MICAKNYETVSKFVKVMPKIRWPLFSRTRCICTFPRSTVNSSSRPSSSSSSSKTILGAREFFSWGQRHKFGDNCLRYYAYRKMIAVKHCVCQIFCGTGEANLGAAPSHRRGSCLLNCVK